MPAGTCQWVCDMQVEVRSGIIDVGVTWDLQDQSVRKPHMGRTNRESLKPLSVTNTNAYSSCNLVPRPGDLPMEEPWEWQFPVVKVCNMYHFMSFRNTAQVPPNRYHPTDISPPLSSTHHRKQRLSSCPRLNNILLTGNVKVQSTPDHPYRALAGGTSSYAVLFACALD